MQYTTLTLATLLTLASAKDIAVAVGKGGGLTFSPDNVKATKGDRLVFTFESGTHDVAVSSFAKPCQPATEGQTFYSGQVNGGSGKDVFTVDVKGEDPLWVYCSVSTHCEAGMSMVVNEPSNGNTLTKYKEAAKKASSKAPASVEGGVLAASAAPSSAASSAASSASGSAKTSGSGSAASATATGSSTGTGTASAATASKTNAAGRVEVGLFAVLGGLVAALL